MATRRTKAKAEDLEARVLAEVEKGKQATSAEAVDRAFRAFDLWKRYRKAQETERAERKRTGDAVIAAEARVKEALEQEASSSTQKLEILAKAREAWQTLTEAKSERADTLASCRSERKGLEQQLDEAMDEGAQLGLFSETVRDETREQLEKRAAELEERAALPPFDPETGEVLSEEPLDDEEEGDEPFKLGDDEGDFTPWRPGAEEGNGEA